MEVLLIGLLVVAVLYSFTTDKIEANRRIEEKKRRENTRAAFKERFERWFSQCAGSMDKTRWIPKETVEALLAAHPPPEVAGVVWADLTGKETPARTLLEHIAKHNAAYLERQKASLKSFFDTVEKNPLTNDQIQACVCTDDNVPIVAAAGSGKPCGNWRGYFGGFRGNEGTDSSGHYRFSKATHWLHSCHSAPTCARRPRGRTPPMRISAKTCCLCRL